jgi:hypothetical protein
MGLLEDVYAASHMRETKQEILDYYTQRYPGMGKNGWKQHLIHDLAPFVGDVKPKSLEKRFDKKRRNDPEPSNAEQYKELGKTLPPMPPSGGYHITGTMHILYSGGSCEEREVDEVISGEDAQNLLNAAADNMLQMLINQYQNGDCNMAGPGPCGEPELTVEPIEEEEDAELRDRRGWGYGRQKDYTADFTTPF